METLILVIYCFFNIKKVQGWVSPYYNETHLELRKAVRKFVDAEIEPYAE
jgi:hypothetical protein